MQGSLEDKGVLHEFNLRSFKFINKKPVEVCLVPT